MGFVIQSNVNNVIAKKEEAIKRGLEACGAKAHGYAVKLTPVDTGRLRASNDWMVEGNFAIIGNVQEYAPYVEMGTSKTRAQPFLKPAVADHENVYKRILEESLRNG